MIRRILVLCFILSLSCPAHAVKIKKFKPLAQPSPVSSAALQNPANQISSSESYPKITQLEYSIFKKSYEKQNIYSRLNRLEKKIFNTTYDGLPLANRVDNLMNNIDSGILYGITSKDLAKLETKGILPSDAKPAAVAIISCSAIPQSKNLSGNFFPNI